VTALVVVVQALIDGLDVAQQLFDFMAALAACAILPEAFQPIELDS
jgi:hypothetical protein